MTSNEAKRRSALPPNLPPRGLSRTEASAYIGVSPTLFDLMVKDGRMPKPKQINSRTVWDIRRLDKFFDELPCEGEVENNGGWEFGA